MIDGMQVIEAPDVLSALRLLNLDRRTKHALEVVDGTD
jgi:DNA repair protein RadA/Sms